MAAQMFIMLCWRNTYTDRYLEHEPFGECYSWICGLLSGLYYAELCRYDQWRIHGNTFDICFDVSGTGSFGGSLNQTFNAPARPGVYYITQESTWWYSCYQFGHLLQDQVIQNAIAMVIVNPVTIGITTNTTATDASPAGDYPIVIGGGYFNPNYRIIYKDGTLTVSNFEAPTAARGAVTQVQSIQEATVTRVRKDILYPNPASSSIRLQLKDDLQTANGITVYDVVGKINVPSVKKINDGDYELNVSSLPKGIYIIEAKTVSGIKTFKFY
ncbi:MAG: T9SS type A sorting domain-containing protein [Chitinophagaceae bacterium]